MIARRTRFHGVLASRHWRFFDLTQSPASISQKNTHLIANNFISLMCQATVSTCTTQRYPLHSPPFFRPQFRPSRFCISRSVLAHTTDNYIVAKAGPKLICRAAAWMAIPIAKVMTLSQIGPFLAAASDTPRPMTDIDSHDDG